MAEFKDSERGFGNEPDADDVERRNPNGRVLNDRDLPEPAYGSQDEHYEAVEALMESAPTDVADASKKLGYKPEEYEIRAAQAAQTLLSLDGEGEKLEEKEAGNVTLGERLATIDERFQFLPRTKQELSDAYDLTGKELVAGAATHLNTVLQRQKQYMEQPDRTVRAIVARYVDYARNSRAEHDFLKQMEDSFGNGKGGFRLDSLGTDWQYSGSLSRPILHTLWTRAAKQFMKNDGEDGSDPLKAYADGEYNASNKGTVKAAQEMITKGKKLEFSDDFYKSLSSERNRFDFWVNALQEARKHTLAAGIAYDALVSLGIEKDERK